MRPPLAHTHFAPPQAGFKLARALVWEKGVWETPGGKKQKGWWALVGGKKKKGLNGWPPPLGEKKKGGQNTRTQLHLINLVRDASVSLPVNGSIYLGGGSREEAELPTGADPYGPATGKKKPDGKLKPCGSVRFVPTRKKPDASATNASTPDAVRAGASQAPFLSFGFPSHCLSAKLACVDPPVWRCASMRCALFAGGLPSC